MRSRAAATRSGAQEINTAEEKITAAVKQLEKIDEIKKSAGAIANNVRKIENTCGAVYSAIDRLLADALNALAGVDSDDSAIATERGVA